MGNSQPVPTTIKKTVNLDEHPDYQNKSIGELEAILDGYRRDMPSQQMPSEAPQNRSVLPPIGKPAGPVVQRRSSLRGSQNKLPPKDQTALSRQGS